MLGPKVFSESEKRKIAEEVSLLELKLGFVEAKADGICAAISSRADLYAEKMREFLVSAGAGDILEPGFREDEFSELSPDILMKSICCIQPTYDADPDVVRFFQFTEEQQDVLDSLVEKYQNPLPAWFNVASKWKNRQLSRFCDLRKYTIVEAPFEQDRIMENVILYTVDPQKADKVFRIAYYFAQDSSDFCSVYGLNAENIFDGKHVESLKVEAEVESANVYIVHHPSSLVPVATMATYTEYMIRKKWEQTNPEIVMSKYDALRALMQEVVLKSALDHACRSRRTRNAFIRIDDNHFGKPVVISVDDSPESVIENLSRIKPDDGDYVC